jgi:hypothetical protein
MYTEFGGRTSNVHRSQLSPADVAGHVNLCETIPPDCRKSICLTTARRDKKKPQPKPGLSGLKFRE